MPSENGGTSMFFKAMSILLTIIMGIGVGQAISIGGTQKDIIANQVLIINNQTSIIKILDKQTDLMQRMISSQILMTERQTHHDEEMDKNISRKK